MRKVSKRMKEIHKSLIKTSLTPEEAIGKLLEEPKAKFDASVDINVTLTVDSKKADQQIRTSVILPHGTGKVVRVVVISKDTAKLEQAQRAGAIKVGGLELIDEIVGGWIEFDTLVATPDVMRDLAKCAKVLGPRGLMPSPKAGTVTLEIEQAVIDANRGKVEIRPDKFAQVHLRIGKLSFAKEKLVDNLKAVLAEIQRNRPRSLKGELYKSMFVSSTQGGGYRLAIASGES